MRPGGCAKRATARDIGVVVELVIPDHVVEGRVVDLLKGRSHRVLRAVPEAVRSFPESLPASRIEVLLAKLGILLHVPAEDAVARSATPATGKRLGIELEDKPPFNGRLPLLEHGPGGLGMSNGEEAGCEGEEAKDKQREDSPSQPIDDHTSPPCSRSNRGEQNLQRPDGVSA